MQVKQKNMRTIELKFHLFNPVKINNLCGLIYSQFYYNKICVICSNLKTEGTCCGIIYICFKNNSRKNLISAAQVASVSVFLVRRTVIKTRINI